MQLQTILEKDTFTDRADDVHESHVGSFCVPKCPDVEGSQQQRVWNLQQGHKQTQNTCYTHPESQKTDFRIS